MSDAQEGCSSQHSSRGRISDVTEDYRNLLYEAMLLKDEGKPGRESVQHSSVLMLKANTLIRDVQNPEDALIDAKVVNASSTVLKRSAQALDTNLLSFTREEYYKNTLSDLQEESSVVRQDMLNFQKLASKAAECFSRTPPASYVLDAFQVGDVACAKKKERKQRAKQEIERKSQPENVTCYKEEDDNDQQIFSFQKRFPSTGSHGDEYEDGCLLGCCAEYSGGC